MDAQELYMPKRTSVVDNRLDEERFWHLHPGTAAQHTTEIYRTTIEDEEVNIQLEKLY